MDGAEIIQPLADIFLKEGILGSIIVAQAFVIVYLFRKVMNQHDLRVEELKQEAKAHEAAMREVTTVIVTSNGVLADVRALLTATLSKK